MELDLCRFMSISSSGEWEDWEMGAKMAVRENGVGGWWCLLDFWGRERISVLKRVWNRRNFFIEKKSVFIFDFVVFDRGTRGSGENIHAKRTVDLSHSQLGIL